MGKGNLQKLRVVCSIPIEAANICNILPRPADSSRLTIGKIKTRS